MMFHKFSENEPGVFTEFSIADFEDVIKHIAATGIKSYTISEYDASIGVPEADVAITERRPERSLITVTREE
jgi:hypothetical protein